MANQTNIERKTAAIMFTGITGYKIDGSIIL